MNDDQLLRYSRHILLDEVGVEGQQRLLESHALVVGAGGLGSPVALYLGTAGVGRITIVDHDAVDLTNLQRQIAHNLERVGHPKAESARDAIAAINPEVLVRPLVLRADAQELDELVRDADVVVDCCDNFATRHAINRACFAHGKPVRRAGECVRRAQQRQPLLRLRVPARPVLRGDALRRHGRVRAPGGDHRRHAGLGGLAPAHGGGDFAGGPPADAGRPHDGVDGDARAARPCVPRVRRARGGGLVAQAEQADDHLGGRRRLHHHLHFGLRGLAQRHERGGEQGAEEDHGGLDHVFHAVGGAETACPLKSSVPEGKCAVSRRAAAQHVVRCLQSMP